MQNRKIAQNRVSLVRTMFRQLKIKIFLWKLVYLSEETSAHMFTKKFNRKSHIHSPNATFEKKYFFSKSKFIVFIYGNARSVICRRALDYFTWPCRYFFRLYDGAIKSVATRLVTELRRPQHCRLQRACERYVLKLKTTVGHLAALVAHLFVGAHWNILYGLVGISSGFTMVPSNLL